MNRLLMRALATAAVAVVGLAVPTQLAFAADISSSGPLTKIAISYDLNCQVNHEADASGEWFNEIACGTFLAYDGVLYGPTTVPAGGNAAPRTGWTPVSQTPVSGSGTAADPFSVTTVVAAGSTGIEITQTDTYVLGREHYQTKAVIRDTTGQARQGVIYTAGDCYLQSSDSGYGRVTGTSPACIAEDSPTSRVEQLLPRTGGNTYMEDRYSSVWAALGTQNPLPNTVLTGTAHDNGMAIAWSYSVPANGSRTYEWTTLFSPSGMSPMQTSVAADQAEVRQGESAGYTVTIANSNGAEATVNELRIALPDDFEFVPGSVTGLTTSDPTISGNELVFTGPFTIPADGDAAIHFSAVANADPGTYRIDVDGSSNDAGFVGVTDSAPVTVQARAAELTLTKTANPSPAIAGAQLVYTITVANDGYATSVGARVTDNLPSQFTGASVESEDATCDIASGTVTCSVAELTPGARAVIQVTGVVSADAASGSSITNTASVEDSTNPPVSATANTPVTRVSNMSVAKQARVTDAAPGDEVVWDITVVNDGPSNLAAGSILSELPGTGLTVTGIVGPAGTTCTTISCTLPEIGVGPDNAIHLVARATIAADAQDGDLTNAVELSTDDSTEASTEASVAVTSGSGGGGAGGDGNGGNGGDLAHTGADVAPMVAVATLLLLGGASFVLIRRRGHS